jgi:hypothetical protein
MKGWGSNPQGMSGKESRPEKRRGKVANGRIMHEQQDESTTKGLLKIYVSACTNRKQQIPPDLVVNSQAVDMTEVI